MRKNKMVKVLLVSAIIILTFTACTSKSPEDSFSIYKEAWEESDYETMYSRLSTDSKADIGKEEFVERYTNIFDGIGAKNLEIDIAENEDDKEVINFSINMDSVAGEISLDNYKAKMIKEKQNDENNWFIEWDESLIFPEMSKEDKVRVSTLKANRGEIYDKDRNGLAINGTRYNIGIHPAKYDELNNKNLASLLDIDENIISDKLSKNTDPELFVPLVKIGLDDEEKLNSLLAIEGLVSQEVEDRIYPGGEAFGNLIGYINPITAEELEEDKENIYSATSLIGKLGLETVYEKELRAKEGKEIYISKIEEGKETEKIVLAKTEPEDGKDINISIDTELQKLIYHEFNGEVGTSTAINPKTGEVLAMVSSPSFDSNLYTTYITNSQRDEWENMDTNVFQNKFNKAYSPGSTFKVVTSALGLEEGLIDPQEKLNIEGKSWQKDSSWGDYKINRVSQKLSKIDLKDAFIYSDNIYFAMAALEIGGENFIEESKKMGFGEELPINFPIENSQITNDGKFDNEILLADTGYGQGQVLMSPLHLSLVYSMLVNDGNIMEPILEKRDPKIWKENVISDTNKTILLNNLVNVIEDENGTGRDARINDVKLAGKTGTAEFKQAQEDKGKENGWFVAMDVDDPRIVISTMIENVEGRGGSGFVVPKVKNIIEYYLKEN